MNPNDLALGREVATYQTTYNPGRYESEGPFPDGHEVVSGQVLAATDTVVALVTDDGRVLFRPPELVFAEWGHVTDFVRAQGKYANHALEGMILGTVPIPASMAADPPAGGS